MAFKFFHSVNNPTGLNATVGGAVDVAASFSGYVNELFAHIVAPLSGISTGSYQYRQLFIRNDNAKVSTNTRLWLDSVEHTGQISIALSQGPTQSISNATGDPPGAIPLWYHPIDYSTGLEIGTMATGDASGVWIRQILSGVVQEDPYATFRIHVGGVVD